MSHIHRKELKSGAVSFTVNWRDQNGRQHKRAFRLRRDAVAHRTKVDGQVAAGTFEKVQRVPMSKVFDRWLADLAARVARGEVKPSTAVSYRCGARGFAEEFAAYRSDLFDAAAVREWADRLGERIAAGDLSPKTYNNARNQLASIIKWARERRYIQGDPMTGTRTAPVPRREARFLDQEEIAALLAAAAAAGSEAEVVAHLGLFAGLRRGEIFGLHWDDIERDGDAGAGRLHIHRAISAGVLTGPKTAAGRRRVDVPGRLLDVLERHRAAHPPTGPGFVLRTAQGTLHDVDNWSKRRWSKLVAAAGLDGVGLHSMRHTYASLLIAQGENAKYVSVQLGHASASFTLDVYSHLFASTRTEAMDRLDAQVQAARRGRFTVVEGGGGSGA